MPRSNTDTCDAGDPFFASLVFVPAFLAQQVSGDLFYCPPLLDRHPEQEGGLIFVRLNLKTAPMAASNLV